MRKLQYSENKEYFSLNDNNLEYHDMFERLNHFTDILLFILFQNIFSIIYPSFKKQL